MLFGPPSPIALTVRHRPTLSLSYIETRPSTELDRHSLRVILHPVKTQPDAEIKSCPKLQTDNLTLKTL